MSYGVILFRINAKWNQAEALLQKEQPQITGIEGVHSKIEYLLIQRRDSIGFIEIMRGKYRLNDDEYIKQHLAGMTGKERENILIQPFDTMWENLWGPNEKEQAKQKLEALRPQLEHLIKESGPAWDTPEWGFPKGRRDMNESEYTCAMREMWEETNIMERDIIPVRNMEPIHEIFFGTNGIQYCHKYYIGYAPLGIGEDTVEKASESNEHIKREVSRVQWFSYEEATSHIRQDNPEKRELLFRVNELLKVYCPLALCSLEGKRSV